MKKLLCLLLSILLVLSFAACSSDEDDDDDRKSSKKSKTSATESYEDAIELVVKLYTADLSRSEFEKMIPADIWEYYEDEEGMSVDDCYELVADGMEEEYAELEEQFGEDFKVTYEILNEEEAQDGDIEEFLEMIEEQYGLDPDDFGDFYEVEFAVTISGSEDEDTEEVEMIFVEYKGSWYAAEALFGGF